MKTEEQRFESKYIRNLRKQIIKLKRENAQLKKKNNRLEFDHDPYEEELHIVENSYEFNTDRDYCDDCGSKSVDSFTAGKFAFYKCSSCGAKGKHENSEAG